MYHREHKAGQHIDNLGRVSWTVLEQRGQFPTESFMIARLVANFYVLKGKKMLKWVALDDSS